MAGAQAWDRIDSIIGRGCCIEGSLVFEGGLRVDGQVLGDVLTRSGTHGYLVVSAHGRIAGDIHASNLVIGGEVVGNLHASGRVELLPRARIIGNIHYKTLTMRVGACVSGMLSPHDGGEMCGDIAHDNIFGNGAENGVESTMQHVPLHSAAKRAKGYNLETLNQQAGALT